MRNLSVVRGSVKISKSTLEKFYSSSPGHAFVLAFSVSSKQSLTELKPIVELINEVHKYKENKVVNNPETLTQDQGQQGGHPHRAGWQQVRRGGGAQGGALHHRGDPAGDFRKHKIKCAKKTKSRS